jgi:starch synthase
MAEAGWLHRFVSGYSRMGRNPNPLDLQHCIKRIDKWQTAYVMGLRGRLPVGLTDRLAYRAKQALDYGSLEPAAESDLFIFYSGCGLNTHRRLSRNQVHPVSVVEAVNTHAAYQEQILREEYNKLGLPFRPFPAYEMRKRLSEYEEADAILCPSQAVKRSFIEQGYAANQIYVVPYGFNTIATPSDVDRDKSRFNLLYVGSLQVRKGIRYMVEAFEQIKHPSKQLDLVGPGNLRECLKGVKLPEGVRMLGVLKGEALGQAYRNASVFVQPSLEEGLSLVLGEALSFGLPVVATKATGVEELFIDGTCGYHVESGSVDALLAPLQRLADDPDERMRLSKASMEKAGALGGWEYTRGRLKEAIIRMKGTRPALAKELRC